MSGPGSEIEKIKPHMDGRLTIKYAELDSDSLLVSSLPTSCQDTLLTIMSENLLLPSSTPSSSMGPGMD